MRCRVDPRDRPPTRCKLGILQFVPFSLFGLVELFLAIYGDNKSVSDFHLGVNGNHRESDQK